MVTLTIDGKNIEVEEGTTILEAALKNGIRIPNLCYDRRLKPYGACRLCVVEVEGQPRLFASCSSPVTAGMAVKTDTPKLRKARQTVLELMLVHHPLDCPLCDKAGECDLQDFAYDYGKPEARFIRHRKEAPPDVRGPLIELTANRCILCGKCVRICDEHQGRGALGFIGRGFPTVVQPAFGEILKCDYCGQCIDACPTGALLSKPYKFKARSWFLDEKDTICPFCGCGCTLTLGIRDGEILRSRGVEDRGQSKGNLCGRGRFGFDYIYGKNRLTKPLIRITPKNSDKLQVTSNKLNDEDSSLVTRHSSLFREATWTEALNYISENLKSISERHGQSAIGAIGSHRCTNEDNHMLQKFMKNIIGSNNIDSSAAFGYAIVEKAWETAFGQKGHSINLKSPLDKEAILIIESDLTVTHPVFGLNILQAKREGSKLIVADSRETKLTRHSSQKLKIKPGTGIALLNGIMKIIMDKDLFDKERVSAIAGFSALQASLNDYTPEKVCRITGLTEAELTSASETYARARSRMISLTISASENTKGMDTVLSAANLILLLGDSPASLQIPAEYSNSFGAYHLLKGSNGSANSNAGKDIFEMLYSPDSVRALYVMGEDPALNFPDTSGIINKLKSLDFLVVQDIALTDTAKLAHVVLPASGWAEKDGTFNNAEGLAQRLQKVIDASGQSLPDWRILRDIALCTGKDTGIRTIEDVRKEMSSTLPARQAGFIPQLSSLNSQPCFSPVNYVHAEKTDGYPIALILRDLLQHSGSMSARSKSLDLVASEAILEINEEDAKKLGITDNSHVKVSSSRSSVYLKASVSDEIPEGAAFVSPHFPHAKINTLTPPFLNGTPSITMVNIEAVK